jgi:hypothetical protein
MVNLLCEHSELFSETWPTSGMMLDGKVYALPTQAHLTTDSESSSLPTPTTQDSSGACRDHGGDLLHEVTCGCSRATRRKLMPTPTTMDAKATNDYDTALKFLREGRQNCLTYEMMPTPVASEETKAPSQQTSEVKGKTGQVWLSNVAKDLEPLMPTPTAVDGNTVAKSELDNDDPKHRLKVAAQVLARDGISWGKFEPAIRRWESILGRPAPAPTKPDGKDGAHRLSSEFTEWMMGVPAGWITGVGLSRNDELKACGNGVVPQQAELAVRMLLEGVAVVSSSSDKLLATPNTMDSLPPRYGEAYEKVRNAGGRKNRASSGNLREQVVHVIPEGGGLTMLPTPTVSDTFTDNLKSTQQKEGSMHSVTLPQAVKGIDLKATTPARTQAGAV